MNFIKMFFSCVVLVPLVFLSGCLGTEGDEDPNACSYRVRMTITIPGSGDLDGNFDESGVFFDTAVISSTCSRFGINEGASGESTVPLERVARDGAELTIDFDSELILSAQVGADNTLSSTYQFNECIPFEGVRVKESFHSGSITPDLRRVTVDVTGKISSC